MMTDTPASNRYALIEDHRYDGLRSGESSVVQLKDGGLLLMYSAYRTSGNRDHSHAEIFERRSFDSGKTWSPPRVAFRPPEDALNVCSPSLLRLSDGRIGCVYNVKWAKTHCIPYWTTSDDEGATWSAKQPIDFDREYYVVNNDRLVQLRDGTIVLPYARHRDIPEDGDDKELLKEWVNGSIGIFYSRDGGQSWKRPDTTRRFEKKNFSLPQPLRPELMAAVEKRAVEEQYDVFQEPGVLELANGKLWLWVRSLSHIFYSILDDVDACGDEFRAIPGFNVSCSPQTIKRVPASGALVMFYNDRGVVGFGEPGFQNRTPLSAALSPDEGESWIRLPHVEPDQSKNYCYISLLFFEEKFLLTYFESGFVIDADGKPVMDTDGHPKRRNLASLKRYLGNQSELVAS